LLAKEVAVFQASFQAFKESMDEGQTETKTTTAGTGKQIQELYAQMRKLSTDVFDQIKLMKTAETNSGSLDREREATKT